METVLLAVTGMSPAVLTETIWALAHESEPIIPTRVVTVTTSRGREEMEQRLFRTSRMFPKHSPWDDLRRALQIQGSGSANSLQFGDTSHDIRVFTRFSPSTGRSVELSDIRSASDNDAAADFLLEQVRAVVENPDTRLIVSLAGGRKTMGALAYACMTLLGRETDRLTHVLVNEPFETMKDFYFPGQSTGPLSVKEGERVDPGSARLEMADVPFIPLRNLFGRELGRPAGTFSNLVDSCRENIRRHAGENIRLSLYQSRPEIEVNGHCARLAPREHLVLLFLAYRAKHAEPALGSYAEALDPLNEFMDQLVKAAPANDFSDWRHGPGLQSPLIDDQEIRRALSSLKTKVRRLGGDSGALAGCLPEKGRFSLSVPGPLIHIK